MAERKEVQLQGPRPAALKITKDSHKIGKPPHRPVIIYTVSPKVIHTDPTQFKDLVQRLTGHKPSSHDSHHSPNTTMIMSTNHQGAERVGHGILSPTPGLLPPIPTNIFTPTPPQSAELSPLTHFFRDLSPIAPNRFSSSLDFFQNFPDLH
ncbi:protein MKS1-like [Cucurbita pepo subsp. pepo]|uniref:protein MKS1-like n=1 Tax=Cucurbita pepo subsp. pepo TaxID=3664 RepID=UPI000C9D82A0|nr:protein MKS1-like [Cucurbita pepo subsp. pepo]XP_023551505.1 protein MKS1-like [Cucurbita pepo subsp. pepo]